MRDNLICTGKIFLERPFQIKLSQVMAADVKMFFSIIVKDFIHTKNDIIPKLTMQDFYFFFEKRRKVIDFVASYRFDFCSGIV